MKKTLVTGGAGFLGSHLCERPVNATRGPLRRQFLHQYKGALVPAVKREQLDNWSKHRVLTPKAGRA